MVEMRNLCAICGEKKSNSDGWFLLAENRWEDKLRILEWDERLAAHESIQRVCSAAHVEELVIHWMVTGSLEYPFARMSQFVNSARSFRLVWARKEEIDTGGVRQVGELAVHRESIERVLSEHPKSLQVILDALAGALQRETRNEQVVDVREAACCAVSQQA